MESDTAEDDSISWDMRQALGIDVGTSSSQAYSFY
jgi:hypothetical protein